MKILLTISFLILSINSFSQTQAEMNKEAYEQFQKSDDELNRVYQEILNEYKTDSIFIENLKKSQRIWIEFRDAELKMKFPNYKDKIYGSIHPTCRAFYLMELTEKRIKTLSKWLAGTIEGEVCNGSIKIIRPIEPKYMGKANIEPDGEIWLSANMKRDHRIFGYKEKNIHSKKMILLSIFTNEVKNNPFNCKYGAYYDTNDMEDSKLKYISTEGDFIKVEITKAKKPIDTVYMEKKWFEFEQ
ncbi:MAG TPA: lysozyme inhibitor LprI family protein [Flavobacteriaceae bacterium]|nr:lysozyme inhibitor LprI family protein [Flavobacteriaceae bacterium]